MVCVSVYGMLLKLLRMDQICEIDYAISDSFVWLMGEGQTS